MRRVFSLLLALLACCAAPAAAQTAPTFEQVTVSTTSVGLSATTLRVGGKDANRCLLAVETAGVRFRVDGGTPTSSVGIPLSSGSSIVISNNADLRRLRLIRSGGSNAAVTATCSLDDRFVGDSIATASGTASVGATVDITVSGVAPSLGPGLEAGAIRVTLPTDGTGVVGLTGSAATDIADMRGYSLSMSGNIQYIKDNLSTDADFDVTSLTRGTQFMCNGSTATPTGVAGDQRAVQPWCDRQGRFQLNVAQLAGTATPLITATLGDDLANTQDGLAVVNLPYLFDGSTWDRAPGNAAGGAFMQGAVADNVAAAGNPLPLGATATNTIVGMTPATDTRRVSLVAGLDRALIVRPYANLEDRVSAHVANTDGAATSLVAAQGSGVRFCATNFIVANSSATNVTVLITDGSGGTTLTTLPAAANMGGSVVNLAVPLCTTANTAMFMDGSAAATTVSVTAVGFKTEL